MPTLEQISKELLVAMKSKDPVKVSTLRMLVSAIRYKEVEKKKDLSEGEVLEVIQSEAKRRKESIDEYTKASRKYLASKVDAELNVLKVYLPVSLSEAELKALVQSAVQSSGAKGPQEMGKVMSVLMPQIKGRADGKQVAQQLVKDLLSKRLTERRRARGSGGFHLSPAEPISLTLKMIPEETIARIREGANLVEIVREHVPTLKKRGRNYTACCPFHQERTPSFNVNPEMGVFKCFGCGTGGDAFKFLMLTEGLTYPEAIRKMASRVGITIQEEQSEAVTAEAKEKQVMYGLLEDAAKFFHRNLMEAAEAQEARAYLKKRGLTEETLAKFSIGFAPASGVAVRDAAARKGWSVEILEKAGLVRRKEGGRVHDAFWNRIMFPIWDVQGRMVAFGGRAMGDAMPKYINSSETPVYSKSRHLYGLFQGLATLRKGRRVVILEGYMDVVTCHQFGLDYTAATLGTALTDDHVWMLRRYADQVTLLFDPDAAGANASLRGGELLVEDGFTVDVVTLPDGIDADEILVADGRTALEIYMSQSVPYMDYFIAAMQKKYPGQAPETKLAIAEDVLPVIHKIKDPLLQDEYLGRLANTLRVDKAILGQQMKRLKMSPEDRAAAAKKQAAPLKPAVSSLLTIEEEMIRLAIQNPGEHAAKTLESVVWLDKRCAVVWEMARTKMAAGTLQIAEVLTGVPEEVQEWLTPLVLQERHYKRPDVMLEDLVTAWQRQKETLDWHDMKDAIDSMIEGRIPMDALKIQQYKDLSKRIKGSKPDVNTLREAPLHG